MLAPIETLKIGAWRNLSLTIPIAFVAITTVGLFAYYTGPLCPDVSGQFWNAQSMRRGVRLYTDIVEINPPLWFWLAIPIEALAIKLGVRSEPLTILFVVCTVLLAMAAVGRLLNHIPHFKRALFLTYLAAVLLIMPARQLEQREHLALIVAIPYLVLAATRSMSNRTSPLLAIAIGVAAGLGFALKPYFLAVPVLVECWLKLALRRDYRPLRPETLALGIIGAAYGIAILVWTPDYIRVTLPLLRSAYSQMVSFKESINLLPVIWLLLAIPILALSRAIRLERAPVTVALLVGGLGFAIAWAIQHKSWLYQGLPTTGCLALALAAIVMEVGLSLNKRVGVFVPALLLLPLLFAGINTEMPITPENDISPALSDLREGDAFGLISSAGATTWPKLVDRGLRLSSRYGQYWMLYSIDGNPHDAKLAHIGRHVVQETAHDYRCLPPKVIIFIRWHRSNVDTLATLDPYRYFIREPAFAEVLGHYRLWQTGPAYDAYRQVSPLTPVDPTTCRRA